MFVPMPRAIAISIIIRFSKSSRLGTQKTGAAFLGLRRLRQVCTTLSLAVWSWRWRPFGYDPQLKQPILSLRSHGNDYAVRIDAA